MRPATASRITWPPFQRNGASLLEKLRKAIKAAAPEATETIAYQKLAFKHHGRFLVSYAAFKDHCSLFPPVRTHRQQLGLRSSWTERLRPGQTKGRLLESPLSLDGVATESLPQELE